jgi:group I intron endonuclease
MTQAAFPRTAFIYAITNTKTGGTYIGSTWYLKRRWVTHRNILRAGTHHCKRLQRAWTKHGEATFAFSVLESQDVSSNKERFTLECAWLAKGRSYNTVIVGHDGTSFARDEATKQATKRRSIELWQNPDSRERIVSAIKDAWQNEARKERVTRQMKERHAASSDEDRNRLARRMQTDEGKAWIIERNKSWWSDPENRENMRQKALERCTPEFMAKCRAAGAGRQSQEHRERHRTALKQRMADPQEKARMAEAARNYQIQRGINNVEMAVAEGRPFTRSLLATGLKHLSHLSAETAQAVMLAHSLRRRSQGAAT